MAKWLWLENKILFYRELIFSIIFISFIDIKPPGMIKFGSLKSYMIAFAVLPVNSVGQLEGWVGRRPAGL